MDENLKGKKQNQNPTVKHVEKQKITPSQAAINNKENRLTNIETTIITPKKISDFLDLKSAAVIAIIIIALSVIAYSLFNAQFNDSSPQITPSIEGSSGTKAPICANDLDCDDENSQTSDFCIRGQKCLNAREIELSAAEKQLSLGKDEAVSFRIDGTAYYLQIIDIVDDTESKYVRLSKTPPNGTTSASISLSPLSPENYPVYPDSVQTNFDWTDVPVIEIGLIAISGGKAIIEIKKIAQNPADAPIYENDAECPDGLCESLLPELNCDIDGDGECGAWELQYNLGEEFASEDHDGDGITNLEEYLRGTDPFNRDTDGCLRWSYFLLSISSKNISFVYINLVVLRAI